MIEDIFEGSFMEFVFNESYISPSERSWLRWVKAAEALLQGDLDRNQAETGWSLDSAYEAWEAKRAPEDYVKEAKNNQCLLIARHLQVLSGIWYYHASVYRPSPENKRACIDCQLMGAIYSQRARDLLLND